MIDIKNDSYLKDDDNNEEVEKRIINASYNPVQPSKTNDTPLPPNEK